MLSGTPVLQNLWGPFIEGLARVAVFNAASAVAKRQEEDSNGQERALIAEKMGKVYHPQIAEKKEGAPAAPEAKSLRKRGRAGKAEPKPKVMKRPSMACKRPAAAGAKRGGQEPQSSASSFSLPPLGLSSISDVLFGGNLVLEGFSKFCVLFFYGVWEASRI